MTALRRTKPARAAEGPGRRSPLATLGQWKLTPARARPPGYLLTVRSCYGVAVVTVTLPGLVANADQAPLPAVARQATITL
jgi:hypothetical protein